MSRLSLRHRVQDTASGAVISLARLLPYRARLAMMGWFGHAVLGPLGLNRRIRANLRHVLPDLPEAQARRICRQVGDNFGRAFIELHSPEDFLPRAAALTLTGPGLATLEQARAQGRAVILASAHFGNYEAWRGHLAQSGHRIGALYRPLSNPAANLRYLRVLEAVSEPLFPSDGRGMGAMVRFLRSGGVLGVLTDLHQPGGERLDFLGRPASTATSVAKLALKYDALLLPIYATRADDGVGFTLQIEAPVAHGDPLAMTQCLNDSISARIRAEPGQWFWAHRRWKGFPNG